MSDRVLYETHCHTPLCKHAEGEPSEYAQVAFQRGLRGLIFTCHNPMPDGFSSRVRMDENQFDLYVDMVEQTRTDWSGRLDVRLGLEADYFAGYETYLEKQLNSAPLNFVLGSVHPQLSEFREKYWQEDLREVQRTYFQLLADAAETGLFDSLSHPDLVKNFTVKRWDAEAILQDVLRPLDRIAKTGIAMELNTSGLHKTIPEMNPFPAMLREINRRGIPITLGADAHRPERIADGFEQALDLLESCGFESISLFLDRERLEIPIRIAKNSLSDGLKDVDLDR